jgi:hypothetical protein
MIGEIIFIKGTGYVQVNAAGTKEKLPRLKWCARLYLEVMQGLGKTMPLSKIRRFCKKWEK